MHILHIITGLGRGGAEANLFRVISADADNRHSVISLTDIGEYGRKFRDVDVDVSALNLRSSLFGIVRGVSTLRSWIASQSPDVVQTWLYKADLFGGLAAWLAGHRAIVWNIRSSPPSIRFTRPETLITLILLAMFSWWLPSKIVACGENPRRAHSKLGYRTSKMVVIPNGLDENRWHRDVGVRRRFREDISVSEDTLVFGQIANYHPRKRHSLLLRAFKVLTDEVPNVHLILGGEYVDSSNHDLTSLVDELSLSGVVTLAGKQRNSRHMLEALDVLVSPSAWEGFPNVVLEALFMGRPCLVSNAGESARVVGPGGWVFTPETVKGLAHHLIQSARIGASALREVGESGREHARHTYSELRMVQGYQRLWLEVQAGYSKRN